MTLRAPRGFSLLELMVVVAIVGILMAAGLPSLASWVANTRVRSVADGLQNGIRLAQVEATRRNDNVTLRLTTDALPSGSSTASASGMNWVLLDSNSAVIQAKTIEGATGMTQSPLKTDLTAYSGFGGNIVFNGLGTTDLPNGTILLSLTSIGSNHTLRVVLTQGGRTRLCDPARTTGDSQACE